MRDFQPRRGGGWPFFANLRKPSQTFASLAYHFLHIGPERLERQPSLTGSRAVDQRNYLFVPAEKAGFLRTLCRTAGIPLVDFAAAAA